MIGPLIVFPGLLTNAAFEIQLARLEGQRSQNLLAPPQTPLQNTHTHSHSSFLSLSDVFNRLLASTLRLIALSHGAGLCFLCKVMPCHMGVIFHPSSAFSKLSLTYKQAEFTVMTNYALYFTGCFCRTLLPGRIYCFANTHLII